ncbi:MAG TPA: ThiF family adenylyltransferase, partial [Tepidisphaeraceae bacterium]
MTSQTDILQITPRDATAAEEDRFHRFSLIGWWDQKKLAAAKVLVIGAGALGNEIVKNLALLGVGNVLIADMDRIENSNLSRSVLYRAQDNGRPKAEVAAEAARDIYPAIKAHHFNGNVVYDLGLGVFRWADVVIGGLDNREARLAINRACWKVNRPW